MDDSNQKIGDPIVGQPAVFELILDDHVPFINPKDYGLSEEIGINPANYFITSGDAVEKTKIMDRDFWNLAGALRKDLFKMIAEEHKCDSSKAQVLFRKGVRPKNNKFVAFENKIWKAAGQCRKLLNALIEARGEAVFLETEWFNHIVYCIPKNPRK